MQIAIETLWVFAGFLLAHVKTFTYAKVYFAHGETTPKSQLWTKMLWAHASSFRNLTLIWLFHQGPFHEYVHDWDEPWRLCNSL